MTDTLRAFVGALILDGARLREEHGLVVRDGVIEGIVPRARLPVHAREVRLNGGVLAPGYVDIQVNGGDGILFNDAPSLATLRRMARAHARLGATSILPTLITDTPECTRAAIAAVRQAIAAGVPGIAGLHLEGPHLSLARKGAHDPALIRPMTDADLALLLQAARQLPTLMVTIAPESVSPRQIGALAEAGAIISLGHTDASFDDCVRAGAAGASVVTHLFNAMSQLGNRHPGTVGAALALGGLSAGLIADGFHVHVQTIATALRAKRGPGRIFLITDAMATAGSEITHFTLNGRRINRAGGRLTLADGTLAGADLELTDAVGLLTRKLDVPLEEALAMASSIPAGVIGRADEMGTLATGRRADFIHLEPGPRLTGVWVGGRKLPR